MHISERQPMTIQEAEIRDALIAARDTMGKDAGGIPAPVRVLADPSDTNTILESTFVNAGLDLAKFAAMQRQARTDLDLSVAAAKDAAVKASTATPDTLLEGWKARIDAVTHLYGPTKRELLETPITILSSQGLPLLSEQIGPGNSSVKFRLQSRASDTSENVVFYYLWENPKPAYSLITVNAYLIAKGYCISSSAGGFLPGDRHTSYGIDASLHLLEWWNQPPTQPVWKSTQKERVAYLGTDSGSFADSAAVDYTQVYRGYDLMYDLFLVPPQGVVVFAVRVGIGGTSSDGWVDLDFASGDYSVICPDVLVATLS